MEIILAIILGGLFGGALYFSGASNPKKLLAMVNLVDLSLMKIIFFGIGFAAFLLGGSIALGIFDVSHLSVKTMNLGVIIGGAIFGIGFGWVGTCPGTCVAASGTREVKKAIFAVLGGLLGAFAFSLSYGGLKEAGLFSVLDMGKITLFQLSDKYESVFGIGSVGLAVLGLIFILIAVVLPARLGKNS